MKITDTDVIQALDRAKEITGDTYELRTVTEGHCKCWKYSLYRITKVEEIWLWDLKSKDDFFEKCELIINQYHYKKRYEEILNNFKKKGCIVSTSQCYHPASFRRVLVDYKGRQYELAIKNCFPENLDNANMQYLNFFEVYINKFCDYRDKYIAGKKYINKRYDSGIYDYSLAMYDFDDYFFKKHSTVSST